MLLNIVLETQVSLTPPAPSSRPQPPSAVKMAITLTASEKVAALAAGGADHVFLFDKKQVDEDTQAKFFHIGVTSVEQFSVIAKDQTDLEAVLKVNFELDPVGSYCRKPDRKCQSYIRDLSGKLN